MLSAYPAELKGEFARHVPTEDIRSHLAEAKAHLLHGIAQRVELDIRFNTVFFLPGELFDGLRRRRTTFA